MHPTHQEIWCKTKAKPLNVLQFQSDHIPLHNCNNNNNKAKSYALPRNGPNRKTGQHCQKNVKLKKQDKTDEGTVTSSLTHLVNLYPLFERTAGGPLVTAWNC
jgi:hypothetical protein